MKKADRERLRAEYSLLSDDELEDAYYKLTFECLGSLAECMLERGCTEQDYLDQVEYENFICDEADLVEELCYMRGIELWK